MAILGIGVDVCSLDRWRAISSRRPALVARVLTDAEAALPLESQAARFAAKEALAKAIGAPRHLRWHDTEVVRDADGAPAFRVYGATAEHLAGLGVHKTHLSLSHDGGIATAFVVVEGA